MIQTERMKQRGVQGGNADDFLGRHVAEVIGRPMDVPFLEAAARKPEREGVPVMVAAVGTLGDRQTAEFLLCVSQGCPLR